MPRRDKALPSGSLAERAAYSGSAEYAEADGLAAIAKPVLWKGRLAKVIVVARPLGVPQRPGTAVGRSAVAAPFQDEYQGGDSRILTVRAGCPIIKCKTSTYNI